MINLSSSQKMNIGYQYVLDLLEPCTPFGRDLLKKSVPFTRETQAELTVTLDHIQILTENLSQYDTELAGLSHTMSQLKDIRRSVEKCAEYALSEVEFFELRHFILLLEKMIPAFDALPFTAALQGIDFLNVDPLLAILDPTESKTLSFYIEDVRTPILFQIRKQKKELEQQIRCCTDPLQKEALFTQRGIIAAKEEQEEQRIRTQMSLDLREHLSVLRHNIASVAKFDVILQKAKLAMRYKATRPEITSAEVRLCDAFNPRIADRLQQQGRRFTPISIHMEQGATVITGANMGGKSVALKTIALNLYLAAMGFFVFAASANVPLFDSMHIISEDLESVDRGLSSFGGEILRFNEVCRDLAAGHFSFIEMDEFSRGTNSEEGSAIVRAVVKYLNRQHSISLLATHYDGAAQEANAHFQVIGLRALNLEQALQHPAVTEQANLELIATQMNYGLFQVAPDTPCPKDAVNICRLLNMHSEITDEIVKSIDKKF